MQNDPFYSFSFTDKRQVIIDILASLIGKDDIFEWMHKYILEHPGDVMETDLDEIYSAIRTIIDSSRMEDQRLAIKKLGNIQERLTEMYAKEKQERQEETVGLDAMLKTL